MAFVITTLKTILALFNIISLLSSTVYLGFGAFLLISKLEVLGVGLHEMALILLATGAAIIILSTLGFCSGFGRRKLALQFYSGVLLIEAIYQAGLGISTLIKRGKSEDSMDEAWNELSQSMRDTFETANNCCGFKSTQDRTGCSQERILNSVECSTKLIDRKNNFLMWLSISIFVFAILSFFNYLVAYQLIQEYKKAKREFKLRQNEIISTKNQTKILKSDKNEGEKLVQNVEKSIKTVMIDSNKSSPFSHLPDFLKLTPKPVISRNATEVPRSSGSMLSYYEIAAKYRK